MKYWLISDSDVDAVQRGLDAATHNSNDANCEDWPPGSGCQGCLGDEERRAARHSLDSGLFSTDVVPAEMVPEEVGTFGCGEDVPVS